MSPEPEHTSEVIEGAPATSHASQLAQGLSALRSETPPAPPRPQSELLKDYKGKLPPEYSPEKQEKDEREPDHEFYGAGASPAAQTRLGLDAAPAAVENAKETHDKEHEDAEKIMRLAETVIRGMSSEMVAKVTRIDGLSEDLRRDRRQIIHTLGTRFLQEAYRDPQFRADEQKRRNAVDLMAALVDSGARVIEPRPTAEQATEKKVSRIKAGISENSADTIRALAAGDTEAPFRDAPRWGRSVQEVSGFLVDTLMTDDDVRAAYLMRLDEILSVTDPQADTMKPDSYSQSGRLILRMKEKLVSRKDCAQNPQGYRDTMAQDAYRWRKDYDNAAKATVALRSNSEAAA